MNLHELGVFKSEIKYQCKFAFIAVENMNMFLTNSGEENFSIDFFWYNVQSFLVASANISKLLWNSEKAAPEMSKRIRADLEVEDASPLRSRRFRNLFEHYDEQITKWMKNSKSKNYISSNVGPRGYISGVDSMDMFRNFYSDENVLTFRGEEYKLQPVIDEIYRIYMKLD
ncbi:hypothetical protein AB685_14870 [Bacillus sp. LL01]|uniref:hypothetical protein n=1 Tax=Bacillus sp. LL01 TaxID=1665556 RepID=UPI00064CDDDC|nr:hypothetical protein [Bacillus sp. LL01]KMJ58086.1 hypothetical protein AB685_14870 [Bacillus sp. LL01]